MTIAVTIAGEAAEDQVRYRKGARPGELLCVSGHLGASIAGLKVLQREKARFARAPGDFQPNLAPYAPAIERHLMPKPRFDIARLLTRDVTIGALIDVSDGLASEVRHICEASMTGAAVYEHNVPVVAVTQAIAEEFGEKPTTYALYGGEEYELLFTIADAEFEKLSALTDDVTIVGRIEADPAKIELVRESGEREPLRAGGWNHFPAPAA
jgi:thiamine-monophosphate kinase